MKVVVDRLVQYPNRFRLVNVSTGEVLGVFDLSAVTGTIQQVGTEIDAELFQTIQEDLINLAQGIVDERNARGVDVEALQDSIATKITASGGELGNGVVTFTEASNASNIASGEKASTLFGKIKNWISRLKALAFKDTIADGDISSSANISQSKVSGLTAIQSKLDGIESGANKYVLPVSTATNLGGVKVGSRLSVASDGTLSANSQTENSYTTTEKNKLAGIEENANNYSLPVATATQLGGVKKGSRVTIASDGTISADAQTENSYTTTEKNKLAGIESGAQVNDVTSVNGKVGAVTISKSDVGLGNVDNVKQYSASNPPPFDVITGVPTIPTKTSQLTNDSGFLVLDTDGGVPTERLFKDVNYIDVSTDIDELDPDNGISFNTDISYFSNGKKIAETSGYSWLPIVAGSGISIASNDSGNVEIRARVPYTFVVSSSSSNTNLVIHASFPVDIIPLSTWTPSQFFSRLYGASGGGPLVGNGSYQGKYGVFDIILLNSSQISIAYDKTGIYSSATISTSHFTTFRIYER